MKITFEQGKTYMIVFADGKREIGMSINPNEFMREDKTTFLLDKPFIQITLLD